MNSVFIWRIVLWVTSFAIQAVLYANFARKYGAFTVWLIRNWSMILTWLPLLFLVKEFDLQLIIQYLPLIALTALVWWLHVYMEIESSTYLPIGISKVLHTASRAIAILLLSLLLLHESYSWFQRIWVALTMVWWIWLGFNKIDISHLKKQSISKWIIFALFAWIFSALWRFYYKKYADTLDNFLAVYLLEASIGISLILFALLKMVFTTNKEGLHTQSKMSLTDILLMVWIWVLPFMGSVWVTFAFETWWFGMTTLLLVLTIPLTILFAYLIFKEKITRDQILPLIISLLWLAIIRLFW
jgi:hypothetical protein